LHTNGVAHEFFLVASGEFPHFSQRRLQKVLSKNPGLSHFARRMSDPSGQVAEILIALSPTAEMVSVPQALALPGKGLEGDRYSLGAGTFSPQPQKPDFELTLIEQENVIAFAAEAGLEFTPAQARRNIVTRGVRLNELKESEQHSITVFTRELAKGLVEHGRDMSQEVRRIVIKRVH
jgi:hypothetical protein